MAVCSGNSAKSDVEIVALAPLMPSTANVAGTWDGATEAKMPKRQSAR
jgi:hypothetical protein